MEGSSSSKRAPAVGRNDDWESVCDGIGVDGERQHQRVREGGYPRGPVGTCMFSFEVLFPARH